MYCTPIPTFDLGIFLIATTLTINTITEYILQIDSCDYDKDLSAAADCLIHTDRYCLEGHFRLRMTSIKANYDVLICTF